MTGISEYIDRHRKMALRYAQVSIVQAATEAAYNSALFRPVQAARAAYKMVAGMVWYCLLVRPADLAGTKEEVG